MAHNQAFKFDRGDPFASRFDQVFGAVNKLNEAIFIDDGDITCAQPALGKFRTRLTIRVVSAGNPGASHLQLSESLAIPGDLLPCFHIYHAEVDTRQHRSLFGFDIELLIKWEMFLV